MSKKTAKKIIIFDLDGTLIHSIPDMCIAMNKTLEQFKLNSITEEKLQEFVGEGMLKLSENVLKFSGANLNLIDDFPVESLGVESLVASYILLSS